MNAAISMARIPLAQEGLNYWEELSEQCKRQTALINGALSNCGADEDQMINWVAGPEIRMIRKAYPSTAVRMSLDMHSWGPMISGVITGRETDDRQFASEEFEFLVAKDLDDSTVAVFGEGRSFSPRELAAYVAQNFRRCYPELSLPCRTWR
ncbi:MAG TPA: hypothetical protein VHZ07_17875 [Bryobacteraceae bacterium]|jgi:hypothetical protein|nr:hypothetical protein [Bryobacteraceae bacterium]